MNAKRTKYLGIIIMILAHPIGYRIFDFIMLGPLPYAKSIPYEVYAVLIGAGILELFLVGVMLFVTGTILGNRTR